MSLASCKPPRVALDREGDVLYVSLGVPIPHYCVEDPEVEGLYMEHSFADDSLCGAMVIYYSVQDKRQLQAKIPFPVALP